MSRLLSIDVSYMVLGYDKSIIQHHYLRRK